MKNVISKVFEFGGIQNFKNNLLQSCWIIILITCNNLINAQTIPSTGSSATTCGDCTPTGWIDFLGTPDISNRNVAGGQGTLGAEATWFAAPLPLPPTGDATWITMKDLGGNGTEESVQTTMGGIVSGKVYRLTLYTMGAISNEDGGAGNNEYYGGTYKTKFDYQVGANPRQVVSGITQNVWGKTFFYFIGDPDGSGNMTLGVFPGEYSAFTGANRIAIEPLHLAVELNSLDELDTDGDGVPDSVDIDDDNDGILDTDELTVSGVTYDPLGDEDGDLLPNYLDVRDDNGTSDGSTTDYNDINGDGIPDIYDFDKDGIPNHLDLDADNDGIPDIIEGQPTATYVTPTGIVGANGLDSAFENNDTPSATSYTITNTDSGVDTIPDYLDLDSDNDGTSDEIEANTFLTYEVGENGLDNAYDNGDGYADPNGSFDNTQTDNFPDTTAGGDVNWRDNGTTVGKDTDGDGILDTVDIDDDNDGIPDVNECATSNTAASNASGIQAETSITNSGNAIVADNSYAVLDDVGDSLTIDLNSDTDVADNTLIFIESSITSDITHTMRIEQSADNITFSNQKIFTWTSTGTDENKEYRLDGVARYIRIRLEVDNGGTLQIDNVSFDGFTITCDADEDGIPNELDLDSDNDGIPDNIEAQTTSGYVNPSGVDTDNDGLDDAYDPDCTPCGGITGVDLSTPNNHDGADTADYLDLDSDNDGTPDKVEANLSLSGSSGANGLDSNYDNGDNYADVNGNYDTTPFNDFPDNPLGGEIDWRDASSIFTDNDNDGIPDNLDLDDDNDGILDFNEGGPCNGAPVAIYEAYYTYEDTTDDVSGNNNNLVATEGTAPGSIYSTTAKTGNKSLSLNGNFFLRYNDGTFMNKAITYLSYSMWINPSSLTGTQHLIDEGGATNGIAVRLNGNIIEAAVRESGSQQNLDTSSLPTLSTGTWYHVVITYNNGDTILYLNGTATPTLATGFAELDAHSDGSGLGGRFNDSAFGTDVNGDFFTGFIDEVVYYQDAYLTPAQVAQLNITCTSTGIAPPDTDADGIPNHFDLDADNDGIPDNIEAQTTVGYIIPNAIVDGNGVDTAYTGGLTPIDSDSDGTADYLELDSDNDGLLDNTEAGVTLTGIVGSNGLDNAYDNGDNYSDVNGSFDGSQTDNFPDDDSDVFSGGDVDYRDNTFTVDTDGDGVNDEIDLDDDNDGILDAVEQGECVGTNSTLNWGTEYTLTNDPVTTNSGLLEINNVDITLTRTTTVGSDSNYQIGNDATVSNGTNAYIFTQRAAVSAESRHIFTFKVPIKNLGFTIYDIDEDNGAGGTSKDKVQIIITQQDGSNYTMVGGTDYTTPAATITDSGLNTFEANNDNTNEDLVINSIPVYITKLQIVYTNTGAGSVTDNQSLAIGNFTFCAPLDSDADGVFDYIDLAPGESIIITNTNIVNIADGNDILLLTHPNGLASGSTAWKNRYDTTNNISNNTSYVRSDEITNTNKDFTGTEWIAFVDDNLDPYRDAGLGGPQRHPHSPVLSEISSANIESNMALGKHRINSTSRSGSSWTNGYPDITRRVIINEDYTISSDFSARQLTINSGNKLTVTDNILRVSNDITLTNSSSEIRLAGNSQLIQIHTTTSKISGSGKLYIDQNSDLASIYRYNYMSSPVGGTAYTLADVLKDGTNPTSASSNPLNIDFIAGYDGDNTTPIKIAEYWIHTYASADGSYSNWIQKLSSGSISVTDGYTLKGPGVAQNYTFVGTPNDGNYTTAIGAEEAYLVGNPYPSAISAKKFIEDNASSISGTLYFWQHAGEDDIASSNIAGHMYQGYIGGYSARNLTMGLAANQVSSNNSSDTPDLGNGSYTAPANYIAVGQGFFINGDADGGPVVFNNSQREYKIEGAESIFFKSDSNNNEPRIPIIKFGMNYKNLDNKDMHRQIGISFHPNNTFGFETGYDSYLFDLSDTDFYWKFPGYEESYVIAGVEEISPNLQVPVEIVLAKNDEISIEIDEWNLKNKRVYLYDNVTNTHYPLHKEKAVINLEKGEYSERFYIKFSKKHEVLNIDDTILSNNTFVFYDKINKEVNIKTNNGINVSKVELYSILGQKINTWKIKNQSKIKLKINNKSKSVYICKITTNKGKISKKIILK